MTTPSITRRVCHYTSIEAYRKNLRIFRSSSLCLYRGIEQNRVKLLPKKLAEFLDNQASGISAVAQGDTHGRCATPRCPPQPEPCGLAPVHYDPRHGCGPGADRDPYAAGDGRCPPRGRSGVALAPGRLAV